MWVSTHGVSCARDAVDCTPRKVSQPFRKAIPHCAGHSSGLRFAYLAACGMAVSRK